MKKQQDILDLLIRLKKSDYEAFSDIFMRYHQQIHRFCCKSLLKEEAEEIVQNVFMVIWENRHKIDTQYSFSSYLFSIAKHQVYNTIRNKIAQKSFIESYLQQVEVLEESSEFDGQNLKFQLKQAINQLPNRQREIFMMSRFYQMTYKEIAEKLEISENTVDTAMRRSLNTLRSLFRHILSLLF